MENRPLSLYELNTLVRKSIRTCLPDSYWLQAELSEVRTNASGHCYVEFVQKDTKNDALIAKARGVIWSNTFTLLKSYFERETGQSFSSGMKVLVKVNADFHELYGYSLTVTDIDPSFTIGDMVRRRREILQRLEREGVLTLNKELVLSEFAQRIAVISSGTAAGYGDFCSQLLHNPFGFVFYPRLFPAVMQGERVEASVIKALEAIDATRENWDVVVIIRGGGAVSDLAGFDTYNLAEHCAQFPLPVITGIGHERDDTVLDMISYKRVKTPTAAAEFLIGHLRETAERLETFSSFFVKTFCKGNEYFFYLAAEVLYLFSSITIYSIFSSASLASSKLVTAVSRLSTLSCIVIPLSDSCKDSGKLSNASSSSSLASVSKSYAFSINDNAS